MNYMGAGRMRWACETLDESHKFSIIVGDIVMRGEFPSSDAWQPAVLRRVDVGAAIDVVCLPIYCNKPQNNQDEHPLKNWCWDRIFSAQRVGQCLELDVERFKRSLDEEKKHMRWASQRGVTHCT